jgi:hypothetical protein
MSILGKAPILEPGPSLTYYVCSIRTSLGTKRSLDGGKRKNFNFNLLSKLELSYGSTFVYSIRVSLDVKKNLDGKNQKGRTWALL